jgi:hypothetical protein
MGLITYSWGFIVRKALLLVPAVLLLVAGCSSGAKQAQTLSAASSPPASASAPAPSPTANLSAELLTVNDLPAGWSSSTPSSSEGGAASCKALNNGPWKTLPEHAEADFQESGVGPYLSEELSAGSATQISHAWTAFGTATSTCRSFSGTTSSGTAQYSLQALSFPSYGNQTYAFAVSLSESGVTASGDIVVVRKGDALVQIIAIGLGDSVPIATVERATSTAVARAN